MTGAERAELSKLQQRVAVHEDRFRGYFAWKATVEEDVQGLRLSGAKLTGIVIAACFISGLIVKLLPALR